MPEDFEQEILGQDEQNPEDNELAELEMKKQLDYERRMAIKKNASEKIKKVAKEKIKKAVKKTFWTAIKPVLVSISPYLIWILLGIIIGIPLIILIIYFIANPCEVAKIIGTWWSGLLGAVCELGT